MIDLNKIEADSSDIYEKHHVNKIFSNFQIKSVCIVHF